MKLSMRQLAALVKVRRQSLHEKPQYSASQNVSVLCMYVKQVRKVT